MNIHDINPSAPPAPANANSPAGGADSQIRALEQKLQQLTREKEKAVEAKDEEKAKQIEEQIQEIQKQIAELKRQRSMEQEKEENRSSVGAKKAKEPGLSRYFDESV